MIFSKIRILLVVILGAWAIGCGPVTVPPPAEPTKPEVAHSSNATVPAVEEEPASMPDPGSVAAPEDAPETILITDTLYQNDALGVVWTNEDPSWYFLDASIFQGLFGELIPLVILTSEDVDSELYITMATIDLPPMSVRSTNWLFRLDPELAMESISAELGAMGDAATLTELAGAPAIVLPVANELGGTNFLWIIIRPQAILYLIAEGFDDVAAVEPFLAGLTFMDQRVGRRASVDGTPLTPSEIREQIVEAVEELRQLESKSSVDFRYMGRDALRARMEKRIKENVDPEEIRAEEAMLKLLGLIPDDEDLTRLLLDLYQSQVLGFYDPKEDAFSIIEDEQAQATSFELNDQLVFVHEYAHALQDQYFDLGRFQDEDDKLYNDDQELAIQALVEGEAQVVTFFYILDNVEFEEVEDLAAASGDLDLEVLEQTPAFIRESLAFPYEEGQAFVQSVFMQGEWEAVNQLWEALPASTEQILHPEKYPADVPTAVALPADLAAKLGDGWQESLRDVWGEFQLRLLLSQAIGMDGDAGAAGWDGDQYVFLTDGSRHLFLMEIVWDDAGQAVEGVGALQGWLEGQGFEDRAGHRFGLAGRSAFLRSKGERVFFGMANDEKALAEAVAILGWEPDAGP